MIASSLHAAPPTRVAALIILAVLLGIPRLSAQDDTHYLAGKVYIIRITPYVVDTDSIQNVLVPAVDSTLKSAGGMTQHIQTHLHTMSHATSSRWFIGYFHPERQSQEELMRDFDLLVWLFHGHDVQIMPIEMTNSPATTVATPTPQR